MLPRSGFKRDDTDASVILASLCVILNSSIALHKVDHVMVSYAAMEVDKQVLCGQSILYDLDKSQQFGITCMSVTLFSQPVCLNTKSDISFSCYLPLNLITVIYSKATSLYCVQNL